MRNWTIGRRIIFGFASLLAISALVAGASFAFLKQVKGYQQDIVDDALPGITAAGQVKFLVCEIQLSLLRNVAARTPEEKKAFEGEIDAQAEQIQKIFGDYEKTIARAEDREQFNRVMVAREAYIKGRGPILELSRAGKDAEAQELNRSTLRPLYAAYLKECDALFQENANFAATAALASQKAMQLANLLTLLLTIASISLGAVLAFTIARGVSRVLTRVSGELSQGSEQIAVAAGQVSSSSQSLAEGASEQAASLEETSASLEEMASMTKRNAENSQKVNDLAKQTRDAAEIGAADMQEMSAAMDAIKASSDDIAKIIKTIDEIAFQTNILALNAAVEAARAGEAGMGFAVVADEVRNLAQRSAQAAKETSAKIEGAIDKTGHGVGLSAKVAKALDEIVTRARQVDELAAAVASASREQSQGIDQVNLAVGQMDKVTQSNAASAEESASAAQELNGQAEAMKGSVAELLKLVGGPAQTANRGQPVALPEAPRKQVPAVPVKRSKPTNGIGPAPQPPMSAAKAVAHKRAEIPMEGDFKDF